jgi:hypothetical protein
VCAAGTGDEKRAVLTQFVHQLKIIMIHYREEAKANGFMKADLA